MKRNYLALEIELRLLETADVICGSPEYNSDGTDDMGNDVWE